MRSDVGASSVSRSLVRLCAQAQIHTMGWLFFQSTSTSNTYHNCWVDDPGTMRTRPEKGSCPEPIAPASKTTWRYGVPGGLG